MLKSLHATVAGICFGAGALGAAAAQADVIDTIEALGQELYFDANLSQNGTQSCATCHNPDYGFVDPRESVAGKMASLGDDGVSLGDRNAPTAAYAMFSPKFHWDEKKGWVGGQFHDGREADLAGQAGGPPLNPVEMGMPSKAAVAERLAANPDYIAAFSKLYKVDVTKDADAAYAAMADAIAAFERTDLFAPFDSKYDRALRGEYTMTKEEELGQLLFFSQQFTNCNLCHQLKRPLNEGETFTNYEYRNIGVPVNTRLRALNGVGADFVDPGLLANPQVTDKAFEGMYKTPTLRNVAVTGPYMHNGVFEDLRTVVLFYNRYNTRDPKRQINPETGKPWGAPEVAHSLAFEELTVGPALDDRRVDALVAFMKTLTDQRYEDQLEE